MEKLSTVNQQLENLPEKITEENVHLYPKEMQEMFYFFKKNKDKILLPERYFRAQRSMLIRNTNELHKKSPNLPIKKVLLTIMEPLPDFLPGHNLVTVTEIITSTWEELQQKVAA